MIPDTAQRASRIRRINLPCGCGVGASTIEKNQQSSAMGTARRKNEIQKHFAAS
jgi:hypothetical protein